MSEVSFVKQFLQTLDAKPIKLQPDHAVDLKQLELKSSYTLPRMSHPMKRPSKPTIPGAAPSLTISLKSLKDPILDVKLINQPFTASVLDIKKQLVEQVGLVDGEGVRLLYKSRPAADSKTVKDLLGGEDGPKDVELKIMFVGGAPKFKDGRPAKGDSNGDVKMEDAPLPVAPGEENGANILDQEDFWSDLKGFLDQRVKDTATADVAVRLFRDAWKGR